MDSAQPAQLHASINCCRTLLTELFLLLLGIVAGWLLRAYRTRLPPISQSSPQQSSVAPQFLREALEWCLRMSGARRVLIWQIHRRNQQITAFAGAGGARPGPQPLLGSPIAWAAGESVSLRIQPAPIWSDAQQVFAIPVRTVDGSEVVATFEIDDATPLPPTQFDGLGVYLGGMMSIEAERTSLGVQHAHTEELIQTLRALPDAPDADALGRQLAHAILGMVNGSGSAVALWENEGGTVIAGAGDAPSPGMLFGAAESEAALAIRAGSSLIRKRGTLGSLPMVSPQERLVRKPVSLLAVPLKIDRDVVGVLAAWSDADLPQHGVQDLQTLAPYAALQLQRARELGVMRARAERDPLTGMYNRRSFESFFHSEAARYDRYQRPFAVVMLDIDHFKAVNDRYGHEAGDFVLQLVSEVIRASLRSVDFAARLGGEEFVVVLPETDIAKAIEIAERIRERVEQLNADWRGQRIDIRISAGVAAIPECVRFVNQLVRAADAALYASKNQGRNRVMAAGRGN